MNYEKLMLKIQNHMINKGILSKEISKLLNTSPAYLSRVFSCKSTIHFIKFASIIDATYQNINDKEQMLIEFCQYKKMSPQERFVALEYSSMNGLIRLLESIINLKRDEYANLYEIILKRSLDINTGMDVYWSLKGLKLKNKDLKLLSYICEIYSIYDINNFKGLEIINKDLEERVKDIKHEYIESSFNIRLKELCCYEMLFNNEISKLQDYTKHVIKDEELISKFPIRSLEIIFILAQSYIFTDFNKTKLYIEMSERLLPSTSSDYFNKKRKYLNNTLDFARIFWGKETEKCSLVTESEKAYFLIKKGEKEEAKKILEKLLTNSDIVSPFTVCYLGLATDDMELLNKSYKLFQKQGNLFYSQLPVYEKRKLK